MAVMGLITSPGVLIAMPASVLVGFAFAAGGLAVTTYLRDFADFQYIQLFMLPMYLFATTFYPLSTYPAAIRPVIEILPLYQSIQLVREPALGHFSLGLIRRSSTCSRFGAVGVWIAARRMTRMMLS